MATSGMEGAASQSGQMAAAQAQAAEIGQAGTAGVVGQGVGLAMFSQMHPPTAAPTVVGINSNADAMSAYTTGGMGPTLTGAYGPS